MTRREVYEAIKQDAPGSEGTYISVTEGLHKHSFHRFDEVADRYYVSAMDVMGSGQTYAEAYADWKQTYTAEKQRQVVELRKKLEALTAA